jgi:hypothetical protein
MYDNNYILGGMEANLKGISTHTFFWVLTKQGLNNSIKLNLGQSLMQNTHAPNNG